MVTISLHDTVAIRAISHTRDKTNWVDIHFVDYKGERLELSIFTKSYVLAAQIAQALNELEWDELAPYIECPHCNWTFKPESIDQHIEEKHSCA